MMRKAQTSKMSVYFVSDLHLKPERPDLTRAFSQLLASISDDAERLYMLGDIFEAWVGDDTPVPDLSYVLDQLRELSDQGCLLFFQKGNRDFLVGNALAERIGAEILDDSVVHNLSIGPVLLMHGDQLCTDDKEYIQFRSMVRNPLWQQQFLEKSLDERLEIARQLRETSQQRGQDKAEYITDVSPDAVEQAILSADVNILIHGHTHRPAVHTLTYSDKEATRIVLGDWDKKGWYLKIEDGNYRLIDFDISV